MDTGSTNNLVFEEMVEKLGLKRIPHPCPYRMSWLQVDHVKDVKKECWVNFNIVPFKDEVLWDVLSMSACHVLLGRPSQFDRGAIYDYCR